MASASSGPGTVMGRVDAAGRLIFADPPLAALQEEAGSSVGRRLALPQIAAVARLARQLNVPVSRSVIAAGATSDYDLWVRATFDGDDILLEIEGWRSRQPTAPRLDLVLATDEEPVVPIRASGEWSADAELRLTSIGPDLAERLGVDADAAIGQPLTKLFKLEEDEDGNLPLLAGLAARSSFAGQQVQPRAGGPAALLLSADVRRDEDGRFAGFTGRALPAAPALAMVQPPEFATGLTGDFDRALRTPLDRIIAAADKIVERSEGPLRSDYATYAGDIAGAARHLHSVIRSMSEGSATASSVDLARCASEAIGLVAAAAEAKEVAITLAPGAGAVLADAEERGIVQILVNILSNAVRHSPPGGQVRVESERHGDRSTVSIADEGPGISADDQQRIFDRFERLGSTEAGGVGLGLAIARRLARSMGGDVHLQSVLGQGARFTLNLPGA